MRKIKKILIYVIACLIALSSFTVGCSSPTSRNNDNPNSNTASVKAIDDSKVVKPEDVLTSFLDQVSRKNWDNAGKYTSNPTDIMGYYNGRDMGDIIISLKEIVNGKVYPNKAQLMAIVKRQGKMPWAGGTLIMDQEVSNIYYFERVNNSWKIVSRRDPFNEELGVSTTVTRVPNGQDTDKPTKIVEKFFSELSKPGNGDAGKLCVEEDANKVIKWFQPNKEDKFKVIFENLDGQYARVDVIAPNKQKFLQLQKINGEWKIRYKEFRFADIKNQLFIKRNDRMADGSPVPGGS